MKGRNLLTGTLLMVFAISAPLAAKDATPEQSEDRFAQMQTMMKQAHNAAFPAERQKLMENHMKLMQEQMSAMHGMMGGRMMGGAQKGTEEGSETAPPMQTMMQRMDMMQQMMGQLMQQHQLMMKPAQ